jgi:hypothetical protein
MEKARALGTGGVSVLTTTEQEQHSLTTAWEQT